MCCYPQNPPQIDLDLVQTILSIVALVMSVIAFFVANCQYKKNQKSSDESNQKFLKEINQLTDIVNKQQEIAEKQLTEMKSFTKPIIHLKQTFKLVLPSSADRRDYDVIEKYFSYKNIGKRYAKNVTFSYGFFNDKLEIVDNQRRFLDDKLFPDQQKEIELALNLKGNKKHFYTSIHYYDDVLKESDSITYYYDINYPKLDDCLNTDPLYMEIKLKEIGII